MCYGDNIDFAQSMNMFFVLTLHLVTSVEDRGVNSLVLFEIATTPVVSEEIFFKDQIFSTL